MSEKSPKVFYALWLIMGYTSGYALFSFFRAAPIQPYPAGSDALCLRCLSVQPCEIPRVEVKCRKVIDFPSRVVTMLFHF